MQELQKNARQRSTATPERVATPLAHWGAEGKGGENGAQPGGRPIVLLARLAGKKVSGENRGNLAMALRRGEAGEVEIGSGKRLLARAQGGKSQACQERNPAGGRMHPGVRRKRRLRKRESFSKRGLLRRRVDD